MDTASDKALQRFAEPVSYTHLNMEAEFREAVGKHDFEKIGKLKEEGYKPSEESVSYTHLDVYKRQRHTN